MMRIIIEIDGAASTVTTAPPAAASVAEAALVQARSGAGAGAIDAGAAPLLQGAPSAGRGGVRGEACAASGMTGWQQAGPAPFIPTAAQPQQATQAVELSAGAAPQCPGGKKEGL